MPPQASGFQSTFPKAPPSGWVGPGLDLRLVHPPELAGQRFRLQSELIFGRSPEPGVVSVFHETVSRRHAQVRAGLGGVLWLHDLGSRNGSRVNGGSPELTPLVAQSVVRLGDVIGVVDEPCDRRFDEDAVLPGTSARMALARKGLDLSSRDPAPVLILGETGTGKERLARAVHELSGRAGPYLTLNCAELSPQLIESQLFGHERGAFTGAASAKPGLFAAAHGGTLLLDEIGELPAELQPKLLRVLQEGEVRPLGSVHARSVDVRVVAATNRNLSELVEQDRFRRDLYARLSIWELSLPALRERRQDVLHWAELLLAAYNAERGTNVALQLLPDAAERVVLHPWLDNLRGLDRLVHRLAGLEYGRPVGVRALGEAMPEFAASSLAPPPSIGEGPARGSTPPDPALRSSPDRSTAPPDTGARPSELPSQGGRKPTREELLAVYDASGRSVRATSKHFGKDRRQIYRWLESFGIPRDRERD